MNNTPITVSIGHAATTIDRAVFTELLESSVKCESAPFTNALRDSRIRFFELVKLARGAGIPYVLFFAPPAVVAAQIKQNLAILHDGVDEGEFKMSPRGSVRLTDVELIVKDIRRKQTLLRKHDSTLSDNTFPGLLRRSTATVEQDANLLLNTLGIDRSGLRSVSKKEAAYEYLVERIEQHNIFVSRSTTGWMPQSIPKRARFSGVCIRDRKVPFIFLNNRDANEGDEPAGRRILTLTLLAVCMARNRFQLVSYTDRSEELIAHREFEIAEEMLMPASVVSALNVSSLDDARAHANAFSVTPSAFVMRAWRLKLIDQETAAGFLEELRSAFLSRTKEPRRPLKDTTALRRYNSAEYSRALLRQFDAGHIPASEIRRTLFRNRLPVSAIDEFRAALG